MLSRTIEPNEHDTPSYTRFSNTQKQNASLLNNLIASADGPKMANLEEIGEVLEEDKVDEVLQQCSDISNKLRNALGSAKGMGS